MLNNKFNKTDIIISTLNGSPRDINGPMHKLKFCYDDEERFIMCSIRIEYIELMKILMKCFHISGDWKDLVITCEGYEFDGTTFEYYLKLFPNSANTFQIKTISNQPKIEKLNSMEILTDEIFSVPKGFYSCTGDVKCICSVSKDECAVPVYRQNCFINEIPKLSADVKEHIVDDLPCPDMLKRVRSNNNIPVKDETKEEKSSLSKSFRF